MSVRAGLQIRSLDGWLLLAVVIGAALRFSRLGDFDNQYYTATVVSMLQSSGNFLFASFDPGGVVMVDKPPVSFWIQAIPAAIFGVSRWSVTVPQVLAGTLAIFILYMAIRPAFGRIAAVFAALVLALMPASVVIDSRNEPDSLLSFALLLAAFCVIRGAQTGRWRWVMAFALLIGIGFNVKMLVAFVPLPAFLLYYTLSTRALIRQVATRTALAIGVLLAVSLSWMSVVAITSPDSRPYVGSTRDNSIWTLAFAHNGLDRFTSFIGPRQRRPIPPAQTGAPIQRGGPLALPGYSASPGGGQSVRPPPISQDAQDTGLLGLLSNPLAGQLGWLLPLGLFTLTAVVVVLLPEQVFRHPGSFFALVRESPSASQSILWGGWLTTAVLVFGLANATTTHPYYLVGVAVPLAAVLGIGLSLWWSTFNHGGATAWLLPSVLSVTVVYQAYGSSGLVGDWATALVLGTSLPAVLVMAVAIWRRLTAEPLAAAAVASGALSVLVLPLVLAVTAGGRVAGPGLAPPRPASTPLRPAPAPSIDRGQGQVSAISSFIMEQGDSGSVFGIGTVNARAAAPFIIAGVPAVAIGGFSGSDPVFSTGSFRAMAERGELRYFLMPHPGALGRPGHRSSQERILGYVSRTWENVSLAAGLPPGSLYRYPGRQTEP
jgi:4-amino-4-deoxy-L-arabinose transferase-like glycosyltransferase